MNLLEQLAYVMLALGHAVRAGLRPAAWGPFVAPLACSVLAVLALVWSAHPALSWLSAPLLARAGWGDVLRYPDLFRALPALLEPAGIAIGALVDPLAAGAATLAFAAAYRGRPLGGGEAARGALRRAPALVLAAAPPAIVRLLVPVGLAALAGVRLSPLTRSLLPGAGGLVVLLARAAWFYVVAEVMLAGRGAPGALAAIPRSFARGFVPAWVAIAIAGLPAIAIGAIATGPLAPFADRVPETSACVAVARAAMDAAAGVVLAGTATMIRMGALAEAEEA